MKIEMEMIEEEKFNLESTNNEKDIKIMELEQQISEFMSHVTTVKPVEVQSVYTKSNSSRIDEFY